MKLGGITRGGTLGGWNIVNIPATRLPEDLASAQLALFGAKFNPIWYVGNQLVNGMNHMLICEVTRSTKNADKVIAAVIVNIPAGCFDGSKATIVRVIEDVDLVEGVPNDVNVKKYFDEVLGKLQGVGYKPILYCGSKVTKGVNYIAFYQALTMYPGSEPYGVIVEINVFQDNPTLVSIEKLD